MSYSNQATIGTGGAWNESAISILEHLMHQDRGDSSRGQNLSRFYEYTRGSLLAAANSIASAEKPVIGIITGFYINSAHAAETDGVVAAAQMAYFFKLVGIECCIATDAHCAPVCRAALEAVNCADMLQVISADPGQAENHVYNWKGRRVTHAIAIERPGPSISDGRPYNMRGQEVENCAPLHLLFSGGDWRKIAIIDRGNEIGSGSLRTYMIAEDIKNGGKIACKVGTDDLIVSRVSHWGGNALIAAIAVLRQRPWTKHLSTALGTRTFENIMRACSTAGAVDGITLERSLTAPTIDALPMGRHIELTRKFLRAVDVAISGQKLISEASDVAPLPHERGKLAVQQPHPAPVVV